MSSSDSEDIVVLSENTTGNDLVVGDIHGSVEQLNLVLDKLGENDRLFIVGDLADRGPASFEVYLAIITDQVKREEAGLPPRILVTRGNHEDVFLKFYQHKDDPEHECYKHFMHEGIGGKWALTLGDEELALINQFASSLPYIIHVDGEKPFNVVHADMPFDDNELFRRINEGTASLTDEEKKYATWARRDDMVQTGRHAFAILTYCGHSIADGVRKDTNHVNLDIGTFVSQILCVANHTKGSVELIGNTELQTRVIDKGRSAKSIKREIDQQMGDYHKFIVGRELIKIYQNAALSNPDKIQAIDKLISEFPNLKSLDLTKEERDKLHGYNLESAELVQSAFPEVHQAAETSSVAESRHSLFHQPDKSHATEKIQESAESKNTNKPQ